MSKSRASRAGAETDLWDSPLETMLLQWAVGAHADGSQSASGSFTDVARDQPSFQRLASDMLHDVK